MYNNNYGIINGIIMFIVTVIIAWIAFSLILLWARPVFYNADTSVNWWTTLWVAAVVILFAWIIGLILWWLFKALTANQCAPKCAPRCPEPCPDPCPPKCPEPCPDPCDDPCKRPRSQGLWSPMW